MKVVSLFIFEPCSGWQIEDIHDYSSFYACTDAFAEDLCKKEDMQLYKKEVDCVGSAMVLHLELRSNYQIRHAEANQAHYKAEAVMVYE